MWYWLRWFVFHFLDLYVFHKSEGIIKHYICALVLQGLMEVKSPYLEELLSLLMTIGTETGTTGNTAGPVAMVISLLLQETEEQGVKIEVDSKM